MEPVAGAITPGGGHRVEEVSSAAAQVVGMEQFLQEWIAGDVSGSAESFRPFESALSPQFFIVGPTGEILSRSELISYMEAQHGADPLTKRWVEGLRPGYVGGGVVVLMFEEWQVRDGELRGSLVSALLQVSGGQASVTWLHIHETPLPGARPRSLPFEDSAGSA